MPVKKETKPKKEAPKKDNTKEILNELERKIEALFHGMVSMKEDLRKVKDRMGL